MALKFYDNERRVRETIYGRKYTVRTELTHPNGTYGIRVINCFAFNKKNRSIELIDDRGCPVNNNIMTKFIPNSDGTQANAVINSMFKFPEGSEVHLQCDVLQCAGGCNAEIDCSGSPVIKGDRALGESNDGMLLAATTVFVLDPNSPSIFY